jgi:hypothetical protein
MTSKPTKIGEHLGIESENPIEKIYKNSLLSASEKIPNPEVLFSIADPIKGDVDVGTKGNISVFFGPKKARKTFAISSVAAVVAGNKQFIQFKPMLGRRGKVLYIDTEQGRYDCQRVLFRQLSMIGVKAKEMENNLIFLSLRPINPITRMEVIDFAINKHRDDVDMIVIDGVKDLILNINDPAESTLVVTKLMALSDIYNIHLLCVIHESGKGPRGHIGTELENKAESTVRVSLVENDNNYSAVESVAMRRGGFDPYIFTVEDDIPVLADEDVTYESIVGESNDKTHKPGPKAFEFEDIEPQDHAVIIKSCFVDDKGMFDDVNPISSRKFQQRLKSAFVKKKHKISDKKAIILVNKYVEVGLLNDLNEKDDTNVKKLVPGVDEEMPF